MIGRLIALGTMLAVSVPAGAASPDRWQIVHAGRLITRADRPPMRNATLIIRNDEIVGARPGFVDGADLALPPGTVPMVHEWRDKTVLPGLIDMHVHLEIEPDDRYWEVATDTESYLAIRAARNARTTLAAGFTTVRDLGSLREDIFALRDAIDQGIAVGPRIIAAGPPVSIIGGHGDLSTGLRPEVGQVVAGYGRLCTGADGCARAVREAALARANVIKITATGGILSQQSRGLDQHFTPAELSAIVTTAHRLGLKVAAHAHGPSGIGDAIAAGVDSIEHGTLAGPTEIAAAKAAGTTLVPTLMAFTGIREGIAVGTYSAVVTAKAEAILSRVGNALRTAHSAGVRVAFGTDAGVYAHGRNAQEFALMTTIGGMSAREALVAATLTAATLLDLDGKAGCLEAGCFADLVVVEGDPTIDIRTLERPFAVVRSGVLFAPDKPAR